MSLITQHSILNIPAMEKILTFYNDQVIPRLTKKNKVIAISTAVALSMYLVVDKVFRPPKKLRHIPYQSMFGFIRNVIKGEKFDNKVKNLYLPMVNAPNNNGIYMIFDRLGWTVNVANPVDAKLVLMKHDKFPKADGVSDFQGTFIVKFLGKNIVSLNGPHWKAQRMAANPAFHRSMPVKLFGNLTLDLFKIIEDSGYTVDFSDLMERWTLDAIGSAGFGFDFNALTDNNNEWVNTYNIINNTFQDPFFFLLPIFDTKLRWMFPKRDEAHKVLDRFNNMLNQVIIKKREAIKNGTNQNKVLEENEKDLLTLLVEGEAKGNGTMTNQELRYNLTVFFVAGHDTTANALTCAIYYLAKHPEYQKKAREEAISILGDQPDDIIPTVEQTKSMVYINQVIKETLRINSPAPKVVPRIATEDTVLSDGSLLPKGTPVTVDIYSTQHNERVWNDPFVFNPDRFDENSESSKRSGEGFSWLPFGNGPRQCIGMNFSLAEQRVLLSMLLRKYNWTLPDNSIHKDKLVNSGFSVIGPKDMQIKFEKRY